jgi:hypothetical protein
MKGCYVAQCGHPVNILTPQDVSGAVSSDVFSMGKYAHATIIVQAGSTNADAGNITVEACDNFTPTTHTEVGFDYYAETTAEGDTLSGITTVATADAATGIDVSGNDSIMYVIELDASQLPDGKPNVRISWSACGGATYGSAVAILSGSRYASDQSATAIA